MFKERREYSRVPIFVSVRPFFVYLAHFVYIGETLHKIDPRLDYMFLNTI